MRKNSSKEKAVTKAHAVKIFAENGVEITEKQADEVLDLLYFIGELVVSQILKNEQRVNKDEP